MKSSDNVMSGFWKRTEEELRQRYAETFSPLEHDLRLPEFNAQYTARIHYADGKSGSKKTAVFLGNDSYKICFARVVANYLFAPYILVITVHNHSSCGEFAASADEIGPTINVRWISRVEVWKREDSVRDAKLVITWEKDGNGELKRNDERRGTLMDATTKELLQKDFYGADEVKITLDVTKLTPASIVAFAGMWQNTEQPHVVHLFDSTSHYDVEDENFSVDNWNAVEMTGEDDIDEIPFSAVCAIEFICPRYTPATPLTKERWRITARWKRDGDKFVRQEIDQEYAEIPASLQSQIAK